MNRFHVSPTAIIPQAAYLMEVLQQCPQSIVSDDVSDLRVNAIREGLRYAPTIMKVRDILMDALLHETCKRRRRNISSSLLEGDRSARLTRNIGQESVKRQEMIQILIAKDDDISWEKLTQFIEVESNIQYQCTATYMTTTSDAILIDLKYLIVRILSTSTILRLISVSRKQDLSRRILECQTREQLVEVILESIGEIELIPQHTKLLIITDFLDGAYHRLLLRDRFDCRECSTQSFRSIQYNAAKDDDDDDDDYQQPRQHLDKNMTDLYDECAVCLTCYPIEEQCKLSTCGHIFCQSCIRILSKHHNNRRFFPCPLCRTKNRSVKETRERKCKI
jgi:hypothetical protein